MSKFKTGDIVVANELSNMYYGLTNKNNEFIGEVVTAHSSTLTIKTIAHIDEELVNEKFDLRADCFEVVTDKGKWTLEQLIQQVQIKYPYYFYSDFQTSYSNY